MSTDMTYEEANPPMREKYICSDQDEIGWRSVRCSNMQENTER